jgi:hypothetical protein
MLAVFILAVLGLAFAGLVLFAAMCAAIRNDDKEWLPSQPTTSWLPLPAAFSE